MQTHDLPDALTFSGPQLLPRFVSMMCEKIGSVWVYNYAVERLRNPFESRPF